MTEDNAGPKREIKPRDVVVLMNGRFVDIGEAQLLIEEGKIVKVISFTPKQFESETNDSDV